MRQNLNIQTGQSILCRCIKRLLLETVNRELLQALRKGGYTKTEKKEQYGGYFFIYLYFITNITFLMLCAKFVEKKP